MGVVMDVKERITEELAATTERHEPHPVPNGNVTIIVECAGVGPPLVVRVRRALKYLLRTHGLRAVRVDLPKEDRIPSLPAHSTVIRENLFPVTLVGNQASS
jgi:hypothetical protein